MYQMWLSLIAGNGGFFSGHLILMIGRVMILVGALLAGVVNCQYALGGVAVAIGFACKTRKITRVGFWAMGAFYGLLSGLVLMDAANAMNGPKVRPLDFPIPRMVGVVVVPAIGIVLAAVVEMYQRTRVSR
jgi:hypothetical protein